MATRSAEPGPKVALSSSHDPSRPTRSDPCDARARLSDGVGWRPPTASAMVGAPAAHAVAAARFPQPRLPAAGELVETVAVRAAPRRSAPVVRTLRRFRPDDQFQVVLALARRRGADGEWWYRLSLPGPPNGARGWIPAAVVELRPVVNRIVVRLGARRLEVRRVRDGRVLLRAVAAVAPPAPRRRGAATSTSSRPSSPPIRSTGRSRSRRARTPASPTGPRPSSASTARTCRGFSGRRSRTAASGYRTTSRPGSGGWRRSGRRSTSCGSASR